uniref:IgGFc_binding domain-containing protein n=1 Tax=Rhabditophanes sp. KR3021 TaxID=114890 RepID=A0AC35TGY7_9BILA
MTSNYMFIFFLLNLLLPCTASSSDGTDFVFSFNQDLGGRLSPALTTTIMIIPIQNDTTCSITYVQNSDNKIVTLQKNVFYGKTNEITLDSQEVLAKIHYMGDYPYLFSIVAIQDKRIFVSCKSEVKLVGRIFDPLNGWGDFFIVPSIKLAGTHYLLAVPTSTFAELGHVMVLPLRDTDEDDVKVTYVVYSNGNWYLNQTHYYNTLIGQHQPFLTIYSIENDVKYTVEIITNRPVMLSFTSTYAVSSLEEDGNGYVKTHDYITYMPMPRVSSDCNQHLLEPSAHVMAENFTTRLYAAPPNSGYNCQEKYELTVYKDSKAGKNETIYNDGTSTIEFKGLAKVSTTSNQGVMTLHRLGTIFRNNGFYEEGHFTTYVPNTSEWVTGITQFYILPKNCFIEVYTDGAGSDMDSITIDGKNLNTFSFSKNVIKLLNNEYTQFIVNLNGYGLHSFELEGKYVMYVVCTNVNSATNAAGYLAGFVRH